MIDVNKAIAASVRTGKVLFGANSAIENTKIGRAKLVIMATNCPKNVREDIEYYCKLSDIPVFIYKETSIELGKVCKKPFTVSALTIRDPGESNILGLVEEG